MALTVSFSSAISQSDSQSTDVGGASGKSSTISESVAVTLTEGIGAGNANLTYQDTITLNAGNSYEFVLDIFAGSLKDEFGVDFKIKEVKAIYFENTSSSAICEIFADKGTPADEFKASINDVAASGLDLEAGQAVCFVNSKSGGWTVDATHKNLVFVNNSSADTTIDVVIAGVAV